MLKKKFIIGFLCGNILAVFLLIGSSSYYFAQKFPHLQKKRPYSSKLHTYFSSTPETFSSERSEYPVKLERPLPSPILVRPLDEKQVAQVEKNILLLGHEDYKVREDAYQKIVRLGAATIPVLKRYLKHEDVQIRASLQEAIVEIQKIDSK